MIYEAIHNQILNDLPKLCDSRFPYLEPSFEAFTCAQAAFFAQSLEQMEPVRSTKSRKGIYPNHLGGNDAAVEQILCQIRNLSIVSGTISP